MDEAAITNYLNSALDGVDMVTALGACFFFYNPDPTAPPDHRMPFATVVTTDEHDQASDLGRPSVFRLNVGVSIETYRSMFGAQPAFRTDGGIAETGHDFTALDQVMPHPVYAAMSWICVLNPSDSTFETLKPLLVEAHGLAVTRYVKRSSGE